MPLQTPFDDVAFDASDQAEEEWKKYMVQTSTLRAIGHFIVKHRGGGKPTELNILRAGSFNAQFRMQYEDGGAAVIRYPKAGKTMFLEEKMRNEVAVMKLIQDKTTVPVPFILYYGTRQDSTLNIGPFIIMEYVKHERDLGEALNVPGRDAQEPPYLDPNIDSIKLEKLYRQMADILIQLTRLEFPAIGAVEETAESTWEVTRRPLSMFMTELVRVGSFPRAKLPISTFKTASDYFESLAQLHIDHLIHQRNDIVESEDDCRRKYVARHLFLQLAREKQLTLQSHDKGPFKLWCDDLRPSNVLADGDDQIVSLLDLEFSYAAPAEFAFAPPWWLLVEHKSFAFDDIFWRQIYPRFFELGQGEPEEAWRDWVERLDAQDRETMEALVVRKMRERETRELMWEPDELPIS